MAYSLITSNAGNVYGLAHYICDTEDDIENLPTIRRPGSRATVASGKLYILNNNHEWVEASSGMGGGSSIISGNDLEEVSLEYLQNLFQEGD